jgi:CheY-like chemotaxis protein
MGQKAKMNGRSAIAHVLVVDDDRTLANTLVSLLNNAGLRAKAAYSGPEAIESALRSAPDFVLLDVIMDGIDGVDAAIAICETMPSTRVLLMSGHPDALNRLAKGSVRGHDIELLMKPVQLALLLQRFRSSESNSHRPGTLRAA